MARLVACLVFFLGFIVGCLGQTSMQIGYEFGVSKFEFDFLNPQQNVSVLNTRHAYAGFSFSHRVNKHIQLETGLYTLYFGADLATTMPDTTNLIISSERLQVPLRILFKRKLILEKLAGSLGFGASALFGSTGSAFLFSEESGLKDIGGQMNAVLWTVDLSAGLEYSVSKRFSLGFNFRSSFGMDEYFRLDYNRQAKLSDPISYRFSSNGNFQSYTFALRYGFGTKSK